MRGARKQQWLDPTIHRGYGFSTLREPRRMAGLAPVHLLLMVALAELVVNRIAIPGLRVVVPRGARPQEPGAWLTALDYLGLFLFYFMGVLAVALLAVRAVGWMTRPERPVRDRVRAVAVGCFAAACAIAFIAPAGPAYSLFLESLFVAGIVVLGVTVLRRGLDLGAVIGLAMFTVPFAVHLYGAIGVRMLGTDTLPDEFIARVSQVGVMTLCLCAIASPYCFASRPFARALTKIAPVVVAMAVAAGCALFARSSYLDAVLVAKRAFGVELSRTRVDPRLALAILALATAAWTLTSCAVASAASRRMVGVGLAMVMLAGYGLIYPAYFAVVAVGFLTMTDAVVQLREEELGSLMPANAPVIEDGPWHSYVLAVVDRLRALGHEASTVSVRGDGEQITTIIAGRMDERSFSVRIERLAGRVAVIDTRIGRELQDVATASLVIHARNSPDQVPAMPVVALSPSDLDFDHRYLLYGRTEAAAEVLVDDVRRAMPDLVDGIVCVWPTEAVRHRAYPGRGARVDVPIPLAELASRQVREDAGQPMVALVLLLGDIARRAVVATSSVDATETS
jgi:hypothetical protein